MNRQNEESIVDLPRVPSTEQRSQQTYEEFTASNRVLVLDAFSSYPQLSGITVEDLQNIQSSQILLNLTIPLFLDALANNYFTIHDISNMLSASYTYFLALAPQLRTRTGDCLVDAMTVEGWASLKAEREMNAFME